MCAKHWASAFTLWLALGSAALAQCPERPQLQNYSGGGSVTCPCFIPGERAGAVLDAPAGDYPIEILRIGVGWGSQFGGAPQSIEQALLVYGAGLPDPGAPLFTLLGPLLTDGSINEFDLEPQPGEIVVPSGPFTVALEFQNQNSGNVFAASVVHDGNGCQPGKNVVYALPGGWSDACPLGVTGDWVFYVVYRRTQCPTSDSEELLAASAPAFLLPPQPNPFRSTTRLELVLRDRQHVEVSVHDVRGRLVARLADVTYAAGRHVLQWNGSDARGETVPPAVYFVTLSTGSNTMTRKIVRAQ